VKDINLLPDDIRATSSIEQKGIPKVSVLTIIITVVVVLVLGVILAVPSLYVKVLGISIENVNKQINDARFDEVKKVNADLIAIDATINSKNDILKTVDRQSLPIGQIMTFIKQSAPKGLTIGDIKYDSNDLTIKGAAQNSIQVAEYLNNLQRLSFFGSPDFNSLKIDNTSLACSFSFKFTILKKEVPKTEATQSTAKDGE